MGIVIKQSIYNSIYSYLGFIIGGIYTVLLVPQVFDANPENWGVTRYLISFAMIIVPWAQLSLPNVIIRFFPIFKEKWRKSFMFFILFWTIFGIVFSTLAVTVIVYLWGAENDELIRDNFYLIYPIFISFVLFEIATAISKSYFKTTIPIFLKELVLRVSVMILILLYWYEIISFSKFIELFSISYIMNAILIISYLNYLKVLNFTFNLKIIFNKKFLPIYSFALFTILSTGAARLLLHIDTLMINHYLSLTDVAIYGPAIYIASSIIIPARSLYAIITPMIAKGWANNDKSLIKELYTKSSIVPLMLTMYFFLIIWINIDLLMFFFGKIFGQGKYIVLFLSIGQIIKIATGINEVIINTSKYYRVDLYFQISLVVMTIILNVIFIPLYGINGAAFATGLSLAIYNLLKSFFVYYRFKIHPFNKDTFKVLSIGVMSFVIINLLSVIHSLLISSIVYTVLFSLIYWVFMYAMRISDDVNGLIYNIFKRLKK